MKKGNIAILLLAPFIVSFLGLVSVSAAFNYIDKDIEGISWDYQDQEALKTNSKMKLDASAVATDGVMLSYGNSLTWSVKNKDNAEETSHAEVSQEGSSWYLKGLSEGKVIVTCSNLKGNVSRSFEGIIYENAAVILNPILKGSQNNIDSSIYYGQYDFDEDMNKKKASFQYQASVLPSSMASSLRINASENISASISDSGLIDVMINDSGDSYFTVSVGESKEGNSSNTFSFISVKDGYNVYDYQELLYCTNLSEEGEVVCLRKNFESLSKTYNLDDNGNILSLKNENTALFGTYENGKYNFLNEAYRFKTTYNNDFLTQWNEYAKDKENVSQVDDYLYAGLHVQKDFYGNGFTLNFHNLAYPYERTSVVGEDGSAQEVPTLRSDNLFRGPLYTYALGDITNRLPLVATYGQDNVGMYVEGDNIIIDDVDVKNCDFGNSLSFLKYTGTVIDCLGDEITIKNSRISNGKNCLRVFSSHNFTLDNSLLSYSMNFLLEAGSNEFIKVDGSSKHDFIKSDGTTTNQSIDEFLAGEGSDILNTYITYGVLGSSSIPKDRLLASINSIMEAFGFKEKIKDDFKGDISIIDSKFYNSGIASIGFNTLFNGTYFYNNTPKFIDTLVSKFGDKIDFVPKNIQGISYPITLETSGSTAFYDWKEISNMDISGLIDQNITEMIKSIPGLGDRFGDMEIDIDSFFPIKKVLEEQARKMGTLHKEGDKEYACLPYVYYGGGPNLSSLAYQEMAGKDKISGELDINLTESYLNIEAPEGEWGTYFIALYRVVLVFTGFEHFRFVMMDDSGYLYGQAPSIEDLKANA